MSVSCERCAQPLLVQEDVAELAAGGADSAEWVLSDARGRSIDPSELGSVEQRMSQLGVATDQAHALTVRMQQIGDENVSRMGAQTPPNFFEVLADSSVDTADADDHPLCDACARTALDYMEETIAKLRNEQGLLDAAEAEFERQGLMRDAADIPDAEVDKMARILNGMDVDLDDLTAQHNDLEQKLSSVRAEQAAIDSEIGAVRDASKETQCEEEACVTRLAAFSHAGSGASIPRRSRSLMRSTPSARRCSGRLPTMRQSWRACSIRTCTTTCSRLGTTRAGARPLSGCGLGV